MQLLNNYQQLFDTVKKENDTINSTYSNNWTLNTAAGQQSKYLYQSSSILSTINTYGFWIYMILAVILCVIIWRNPFNIYFRIIIIVSILTYPFYIYPLEELSYKISVYIWDVLLSNTYDNGYNNTSLEYGLNGSAGSFGPESTDTDTPSTA
jgi:multisubunit Na+/H+ antiporter MnhG subunit